MILSTGEHCFDAAQTRTWEKCILQQRIGNWIRCNSLSRTVTARIQQFIYFWRMAPELCFWFRLSHTCHIFKNYAYRIFNHKVRTYKESIMEKDTEYNWQPFNRQEFSFYKTLLPVHIIKQWVFRFEWMALSCLPYFHLLFFLTVCTHDIF